MGNGFTYVARDTFISAFFSGAPTIPTPLYLGLFSTANGTFEPSDELSDAPIDGYSRVIFTFDLQNPVGSNNVQAVSLDDMSWTLGACTVSSFGLFDASTVGNLWYWGDFDTPVTVADGDEVTITAGTLIIGHG